MKRKLKLLVTIATAAIVITLGYVSCRKLDLQGVTIADKTFTPAENKFFNSHRSADPVEKTIVAFLIKENSKKHFVEKTVDQIGYPRWDKIVKRSKTTATAAGISVMSADGNTSANTSDVYYIPFARDSQNYVNASMVIKASPTDTSINYLCDWQYSSKVHGSANVDTTAESYALFFMRLDNHTFGHTLYDLTDLSLFPKSLPRAGKKRLGFASNSNQPILGQSNRLASVEVCYDIYVCGAPDSYECAKGCDYLNCAAKEGEWGYCYRVATICSGGADGGNGSDGSIDIGLSGGTGGSSGGGGTGSTPPSPCDGTTAPPQLVALSVNQSSSAVSTFQAQPCNSNPGWTPAGGGSATTDANGFLYSRINELNSILLVNSYALVPCDKLNIMPLDDVNGYGLMYKRVAELQVSTAVVNRIATIAQQAPTSYIDGFHIQNINNASGAKVNCDYFPVHITKLPPGTTADGLLEYFRLNINQFIDPSIGVSFSPYTDGSFSDAAQLNNPYEQSIGALIHIKMLDDGSVVESDYWRSTNTNPQRNRFTFTTITSPLDYNHPVSGNREFGIFGDPAANDFTFYTMGVDRTSDWMFSLVNSKNTVFNGADALWTNIQKNMVKYINTNGGQAMQQVPIIARPNWDDVKDYLQGKIDFTELKRRLGC